MFFVIIINNLIICIQKHVFCDYNQQFDYLHTKTFLVIIINNMIIFIQTTLLESIINNLIINCDNNHDVIQWTIYDSQDVNLTLNLTNKS